MHTILETDGPIATLTLNRPDSLNSLDLAMMDALVVNEIAPAADDSVRCIVIRGAGRHFMAGGDIRTFAANLGAPPAQRRQDFARIVQRVHTAIEIIYRMPHPVIAAVHGAVAGFGLSLMCACDLAVAAESSYFTSAYRHIGLTPDGGATYALPRIVGIKKAMEIVLLGERFGVDEALRIGLINRVVPEAELAAALAMGVRSGFGDKRLRVWGMKSFLDGSLGSRTAEMLDGSGVSGIPQDDLVELVRQCAAAELNVCLHAIGDAAVRRALDALQPFRRAWRLWRPRLEHAQCVHRDDVPRFAAIGVIASMQPLHAVSDREMVEEMWPGRAEASYAWGALARAGAVLAFGSDAPVESAAPLLGIDAATGWRRRNRWYPELALSRSAAVRAYSHGVAYAAGMERLTGHLRPGLQCDLTIVDGTRVVATVVGGKVVARG